MKTAGIFLTGVASLGIGLAAVAGLGSATSHGVVEVQIEFQDNATAQDLAVVTAQVERLGPDHRTAVTQYFDLAVTASGLAAAAIGCYAI